MKKVIKLLERLKTLKWEKERSQKKILTKKTVKKSRQERERERGMGGDSRHIKTLITRGIFSGP